MFFYLDNRINVLYNIDMTLRLLQEKQNQLISGTVMQEVRELAHNQGCAEENMVIILLNQALQARQRNSRIHRCWESLSQREKQVAALVCSGLTGRQVAARLVLSPETIKTHVRHILRKFNLNSRQDLRNLLADWDFGRWLMPERISYPVGLNTGFAQQVCDSNSNSYSTE